MTKNGNFARLLLVGLALLFLLVAAAPTRAQNYRFSVPELRMQVYVQPDASARIVYDITFQNEPFASPIDIVDIGVPHDGYDLGNFSASIDGRAITAIYKSEFVDPGVEIHLDNQAIAPGDAGTLHVEFTMPDMVYEDVTQDGYASLQITPTWWEPKFVTGSSDIWIVFHLLPGVSPDEVLFQDRPFTEKALFEEHAVVGWREPNGRATGEYLVGASFPTTGMTRVIEQSLLDLVEKFLVDNPAVTALLGLLAFALVGFAFFRFSGGTGFTVFALLGCGLVWLLISNPIAVCLALPLGLVAVGLVETKLTRRRQTYLPAIAQVEGGGIKRGLTAPEAAILLELPLNKVLLLVIFGLLDKGTIELENDAPLAVRVKRPYLMLQESAKERKTERGKIAQQQGIVLRSYENAFLDILQENEGEPVHKLEFGAAMKRMIESVAQRMKGFDLSDTRDYYRQIIAQAMAQAGRLGEIPALEAHLDKTWPWIFLDDDYDRTFRRRGYEYYPHWSRPYIHTPHGSGGLPGGSASGPSYGGKTSFSNVAAGFAGWTENTAGRLADAMSPASLQVKGASGGFINLSGADKVTGDVFKALAASSGGSGGSSSGGSSCACACAGCACACACAGGGR